MSITAKVESVAVTVIIAALAVWYLKRQASQAVESVAEAGGKLWDGITFSSEQLGQPVELTPSADVSQQEWIAKGYLEVLPDGQTRITQAGEQYIKEQQQ